MSMDLTSESGAKTNYTGSAWDFYLSLAEAYGWNRPGTLPPSGVPDQDWQGSYSSCDGQQVSKADALSMASALEKVLADPARESSQREVLRKIGEQVRALMTHSNGTELVGDGQEMDADDDEEIATDEDLRMLIAFLQAGGFRID